MRNVVFAALVFCFTITIVADKPIIKAVKSGNKAKVLQLLEEGITISTQDENNWTPLHWAINKGYNNLARILIDKGADVNAQNGIGWTPLHFAAEHGNEYIAKLLLDHPQIDTSLKTWIGYRSTAADFARSRHHTKIEQMILEKQQQLKQQKKVFKKIPQFLGDIIITSGR